MSEPKRVKKAFRQGGGPIQSRIRGCPHNGGGMRNQNPNEGRRHPHGGRRRRQPSSVGWNPSKGRTSMWGTAYAGCPAG